VNFIPCFLSIVFIGIGVFFVFRFFKMKEKIFQMKATDTVTAESLRTSCDEIAAEIGPGGFNQLCEVKGKLVSDEPLKAELSGQACVYYEATITRRWEEQVEEYNSQTKRHERRTVTGTDTVAHNVRETTCAVDDGTGQIPVRLHGAEIDAIQSVSRFEPGQQPGIQIGGMRLSFTGGSGRRTVGYQYTERVLPLGATVYVLGEARDQEGGLSMRKPDDASKKFFITTRSEEELLQETAKSKTMALVGAIALGVLGVLAALGQVLVWLGNLF